jgi:predicted transcriptional regulator of viral defense system
LANQTTFRELPDFLIGGGRYWATTGEIAVLTRAGSDATRHGLARLRSQRRLFTPARSFHVMVPPEYRSWGAVPAAWFIDPMMQHLGRDYYVGLLSAAAQHGASHQAAQTFQVVTDRHVEDRDFDRVRLRFQTSALTAQTPVEPVNTPTGTMAVSTREATVGDLVERPGKSGGLSNVATILREIGELDGTELARLSALRPRTHARRLGWLLTKLRGDVETSSLRVVADPGKGAPIPLAAGGSSRGTIDEDWGVIVNTKVEPDI